MKGSGSSGEKSSQLLSIPTMGKFLKFWDLQSFIYRDDKIINSTYLIDLLCRLNVNL